MGNSDAALGAIALNRVKHRMARNINKIGLVFVQRLSADGRRGHQKLIRNQQVTRSSRVAGSSFPPIRRSMTTCSRGQAVSIDRDDRTRGEREPAAWRDSCDA